MIAILDGKVAHVSGRGIGRPISLKLASEGARLVANDLDAKPAADAVDEIILRAARPVIRNLAKEEAQAGRGTVRKGQAGRPEDAAGAVHPLCIPESDDISGQTLLCSGGLTGR
jgi:NAD(P)-dependent dehydrogenase (short-subunit alcohol dehydrogenase family)